MFFFFSLTQQCYPDYDPTYTERHWSVAFINLSGSEQIINILLIENKDSVQGLLFIIPMLITVEQLID